MLDRFKSEGFTLIDCLIAVTMLAIVAGFAAPDLQAMHHSKEGRLTLRKIADAVHLARSSAIQTGHMVTLCPSADGRTCGGAWHNGMMVFEDKDNDHKMGDTDELLSHFQFPGLSGSLHWRAFQNRQYLQITPQGFTRYQNGNFTWCPSRDSKVTARQMIINRAGRVRYASDSDGDGLRENSQGEPIRCPG
ncbi:MAG: GspH/FimT family pseudopilin [Gammaproteobacteria bacterium]|nr:GspH/FimT family pseudopilin [Gammaproteobacteria bacterium]